MRMFFVTVGVLAWLWALAVLWIFAESGGALTMIAAGIFAVVAMVALGCERILKMLEEIRDVRAAPRLVTVSAEENDARRARKVRKEEILHA